MGLEKHRAASGKDFGFAVITVSDTRELATDRGGDTLVEAVLGAGHRVVLRELVRDEPDEIRAALARAVAAEEVDLVLFTGGTGIAPRDVTAATLETEFDGAIPGFGELFRSLSYREIGSATILSRATAGFLNRRIVFALPGSPKALRLAMDEIILKEAGHLVSQVRG
ncbi:MAG: molybdenum cofactor biosynthesis protein MoaB [Planctomycetota bacterium]|nr:MAG: molybdenum cofactor biosynthesis protein MoaB [Planctomycetota bacterium]